MSYVPVVLALTALSALSAADIGLPAGSRMPAFEAQDQAGKTRTLRDVSGPNGAVLVFYRSADW